MIKKDNLNSKKKNSLKWTLGWGATSRCDLSCLFCYSESSRGRSERIDVNLKDAEEFLIRNSMNIESINFGTGESFLMPYFPKLLLLCKKIIPDVGIAVTTNGALLECVKNYDAIQIYRESIDELDVSLDFCDPLQHDKFRGEKGSWQRAIAAIELGRHLDMNVSIVMVGMPKTVSQENLMGMLAIAKHFDVPLRINPYMPSSGDFSFTLSCEQIISTLRFLKTNSDSIRTSDPLFSVLLCQHESIDFGGHYNSIRILPDYKVSPSTYLTSAPWTYSTDIAKLNLRDLEAFPNFREWNVNLAPKECCNCCHFSVCRGGSRERRILWHGTLEAKDPYCPSHRKVPALCPNQDSISSASDWSGPSIHLGYLPTIMCKPFMDSSKYYSRCSNTIILNRKNRTVLLIRAKQEDCWELPDGNGEYRQEILRYKLREEIGCDDIDADSLPRIKWVDVRGESVIVGDTFVLFHDQFDSLLPNKDLTYKWVSLNDMPRYLNLPPVWADVYLYSIHDFANL